MTKSRINGLIVAPLTPFHADGTVNPDIIGRYAAFLHANGVAGAFVNGTTGEGLSLTVDERMALAEQWVNSAPASFKVIVHVSHTCTVSAADMARHAAHIGADGIGEMGPFFFRPASAADLAEHAARTAAQAPQTPYYYYHIPSMSGVCVPMIDFLRHAADRLPTLAGIKYTHNDLVDFERCRAFDDGRYDILYGRDETLLCALALGCRGAVGSTYNIMAPLYTRLTAAFDAGDLDTARRLQRLSMDIIRLLYDTSSFNAALKETMRLIGFDMGEVRPPLKPIRADVVTTLKRNLEEIGFFEVCSKRP